MWSRRRLVSSGAIESAGTTAVGELSGDCCHWRAASVGAVVGMGELERSGGGRARWWATVAGRGRGYGSGGQAWELTGGSSVRVTHYGGYCSH